MIRTRFRKRHAVLGLLALELATLPVAAQVVERVTFKVEPRVIVAAVPDTPPGMRSFLVASNAGFVVEVEDVVGAVTTDVTATGRIGSLVFGAAAQLPGEASACTMVVSGQTQVYAAMRKTAEDRGDIHEQAVRIDVRFDRSAEPVITIVPMDDAMGQVGGSCALA